MSTTLNTFTKSYIETALWSSIGDNGEPLDRDYDESDIAPASLVTMIMDCERFQAGNAELLEKSGLSSERAGNDFWLNRNGHGAGFWDEGMGEVGEALSQASNAEGSCDLYVGDDNLIYCN